MAPWLCHLCQRLALLSFLSIAMPLVCDNPAQENLVLLPKPIHFSN
jgi:hypothetical protein